MTAIPTMLRQELEQRGTLPFARFMEVALYCPKSGYYEAGCGQIGRAGDFYTNVSVGSLFGELLARQCAEWLEALGPGPLQLIEAGAHDGQLSLDILNGLAAHRPALLERLAYWLIEPSVDRQNCQQLKLENFSPRVRWFARCHDLPPGPVRGVFLSNELLDAFPVHRLLWNSRELAWVEMGVAWEHEQFVWRAIRPSADWTPSLVEAGFRLPPELLRVLPDGFELEFSPAAGRWWADAARVLSAGTLLTVDYGLTAAERLTPAWMKGTLRAYSRHQVRDDVLQDPGGQDLTAHVNFTQLQLAGERAGLKTRLLMDQPQFLSRIVSRAQESREPIAWSSRRVRQFQTLTHPEHLGRAFRVLVQARE